MLRRVIVLLIVFTMLFEQSGFAQAAGQMGVPVYLQGLMPVSDRFRPVHLRAIGLEADSANVRIGLEYGDEKMAGDNARADAVKKLMEYFQIGLRLPNSSFWVNLRPDSPDSVIDPLLEKTDLGKVLLEADLQLKKDLCRLTDPNTKKGKEYWDRLYEKAESLFYDRDAEIPTAARPWIVPGEIIVGQNSNGAYVYKAALKIMLEEDYVGRHNLAGCAEGQPARLHLPAPEQDARIRQINAYSSQIIKELFLPELTREINASRRYAALRQAYYSLILAQWVKQRLAVSGERLVGKRGRMGVSGERLVGKRGRMAVSAGCLEKIDTCDLSGLTSKTPWSKDAYFQAYRDSFSRGEYNKQESVNTSRGIIIRNYFSGGFAMPENVSGVFIPMEDEDSVKVLFDLAQGRIVDVTVGAGTRDISSRDGGIRRFLDQLSFEDVFKKMNDFFGIDIDAAKAIDPKLAGISFDGKENRLGWTPAMIEWIFAHPETVESVLADAEEIRAKKYEYVIFCGMGGSGLSVQAVRSMFARPDDDDMRIYSLRTTDPAAIKEILDEITVYENDDIKQALKHTLIIPISKSGTTAETVTHKEYFEKLYADVFKDDPTVDISDHMWVMTDKGSPFDKKVYPQRDIQLNSAGDVGGRFTAPTTRIFLMPLALVNPDMVWSVLRKAREMHNQANLSSNDFVHLGVFLYHMAKAEHKDKVTFLFPEKLRDLAVWAEQLVEESLGKDGKGITLFYGEDIRFYEELKPIEENDRVFVRFNLGDDKSDERFWYEITDEGYPVWEININDISEIGGVMLGLQLAVATVGYLWDIRYVDQPGVEGYKRATREVQAEVQPGNKIAPPDSWKYASRSSLRLYYDTLYSADIAPQEIRAEVERLGATMEDAAAVFAAVLKISAGTAGFQAAEIASYGRMTPEAREVFEDARRRIFTQFLRIPAKLGEGPDKNHSYHQNIAQGKDQFLSIYYLPDVFPQPAHVSYDDNLIRAQAIGTVQSLADSKRKVVLLTSAGSMDESADDLADFFDQVKMCLGIIDKAVIQRAEFERLRARMDDISADAPGVIEIVKQMGGLGRYEAVKYLMEHRFVEGDDPMYQELRQAAVRAVVKIVLDTGNRSALQAVLYNDPFIGLRHLLKIVPVDESKIVSGDESKLKQYISYFPAFTDLLEKELGDSLRSDVSIPDDITREWIENILSVLQKAKNDPVLSVDSDKDGGVMKPGGIDLRALPIIAQSMAAAGKALPGVDVRQLQALAAQADIADMDAEWRRIMRDISRGSYCYENLRQFIAVCRVRNDAGHLKAASDWLKRTLMLEEENSVSTPRVMMELLYLAG